MRSHSHLNCYSTKIPKVLLTNKKTLKIMIENQFYDVLYEKRIEERENYAYIYSVHLSPEIKRSEYLW